MTLVSAMCGWGKAAMRPTKRKKRLPLPIDPFIDLTRKCNSRSGVLVKPSTTSPIHRCLPANLSTVWISNPKEERVFEQRIEADESGGIAGEFTLPADATLGEYHLQLNEIPIHAFHAPHEDFQPGTRRFGGIFRVEEYREPEFEVAVDAPGQTISLGDSFAATIKANYYFGSPVTEATVKYKVLRTSYTGQWYPPTPWDWLLWTRLLVVRRRLRLVSRLAAWGCRCPVPWWFWRAPEQPEVLSLGRSTDQSRWDCRSKD